MCIRKVAAIKGHNEDFKVNTKSTLSILHIKALQVIAIKANNDRFDYKKNMKIRNKSHLLPLKQ